MVFTLLVYFLFVPSSVKANEDSYITETVPAPSVSDDADASYRCVWKYDSGNQEMARFHLYTASTDLLDLRGVIKILAPYSYHSAFYNYYGTDLKPEVYLVFSNGAKQAFTDGVWESDTPLNTSAYIYYKYYAGDYYWHPKSGADRDFDYASFSVSDITLYVDGKPKFSGFSASSLTQ